MSGIDFIIDTNVIIAINTGIDSAFEFADYNLGIASVSEVEVLGYRILKK